MRFLKKVSNNTVFTYTATLAKLFPQFVEITQEERDSLIAAQTKKKTGMLKPAKPARETTSKAVHVPTEVMNFPPLPRVDGGEVYEVHDIEPEVPVKVETVTLQPKDMEMIISTTMTSDTLKKRGNPNWAKKE